MRTRHPPARKALATACAAAVTLATPLLSGASVFNEVEPNDSRALANTIGPMVAGDMIVGNSTSASGAGLDYFNVTLAPASLGIYRHRLVLTSPIVGHAGTIRGLNQTAAPPDTQLGIPWDGVVGTPGTVESVLQTTSTSTIPPRFNQWYGFGKAEQFFYRVTGVASTTSDYTATLETLPVSPTNIGTYQPGLISISTFGQGHTTDTDLWVYDGNFNAITGYGNDDESTLGGTPGTGATLQSWLAREYAPGTYYLAMSNFQLSNNQPSPSDDDFRTGLLADFPDLIVNNSTTTGLNMTFSITDSGGIPVQVSNTKLNPFDVNWFQFTVSGGDNLIWNGISPNNHWNQNPGNMNWLSGMNPSAFTNGDTANFTNNAVGLVQIDAGGVTPESTNVSNTSGIYVFAGGPINGTGALTKTGAGELVLQDNNNFSGGVFINGGLVTVFNNTNLGAAAGALNFGSGTLRIAAPGFSSTRSVIVNASGGTVDTGSFSAAMTGPISGPGTLKKAGQGQLSVTHVRSGGLDVADGEVKILQSPAANHADGVSDIDTLLIAGGPLAPTARLDLTNNAMIIGDAPGGPEGGPEIETNVRGYLSSGYAGGSWSGQGMTSTAADFGPGNFAPGYAQAGPLGLMSFLGRPVLPTDTVVLFTLYGDADLNGTVNLLDFNRLAANFGLSNKTWREGDFDYNGVVNLSDFNRLAANFGLSAGSDGPTPEDWAALAAAVPEPALTSLMAAGFALLARRRRW